MNLETTLIITALEEDRLALPQLQTVLDLSEIVMYDTGVKMTRAMIERAIWVNGNNPTISAYFDYVSWSTVHDFLVIRRQKNSAEHVRQIISACEKQMDMMEMLDYANQPASENTMAKLLLWLMTSNPSLSNCTQQILADVIGTWAARNADAQADGESEAKSS